MRRQIWRTIVAALLACASLGAGARHTYYNPEYLVEIDGVSMAKLRGAIPLPRPDTAITVLSIYTESNDPLAPPPPHRARFETAVFETGPSYQRSRGGRCEYAQGQWTCSASDLLVLVGKDIEASVPTAMPTELALRILDFAVPFAKNERYFSIGPDRGEQQSVTLGRGCSTTVPLRRKGETFEVEANWRYISVCI